MLKKLMGSALAFALAVGVCTAVYADEAKPDTAKKEPTELKVCPMTLQAVQGNGAGNEIVGDYKVYFCCGGCQKEFDALATADKSKKLEAAADKQKPKLIEVKVCPISMEAVHGAGVGATVVDNYKVYFCCDGCPQEFAKLSKAKKLEKIKAALKQQEDAKKKKQA